MSLGSAMPDSAVVTTDTARRAGWLQVVNRAGAQVAREHGLALAIVGLHTGIFLLGVATGVVPESPTPLNSAAHLRLLLSTAVVFVPAIVALEFIRSPTWSGRWSGLRSRYLNLGSLVGLVVGAVFIAHSAIAHDLWKNLLGVVTPYTWDTRLAALDTWMHGGLPSRFLDRSLGLTAALDTAYWLWYPILMLSGAWVLWTHKRELRSRLFVAWALLWSLFGTVLAHVLASGGPAFYGGLVPGADPYAGLMSTLGHSHAQEPLTALRIQAEVWSNATSGARRAWLGMSAMPSLHVGTPALLALALGQRARWAGALMWGFAVVILIGSVGLGWHYAVDGYVGIAGALVCWQLAGWALRKRLPSHRS